MGRWWLWLGFAAGLVAAGPVAAAAEFTLIASSDTSFSRPHDLALSPDGNLLYVADVGNDAVKVLDPMSLEVVGAIGAGVLSAPHDVAFDDAGWLYVADEYNDQIKVFDESRAPVGVIGTGERGNGPGQLDRPEGVTVRGDHVWVSDTHNHRILLFKR